MRTTYEVSKMLIRNLVRSFYDLQIMRIKLGGRIYANFRVKLGIKPGKKADKEEKKLMDDILGDYKMITEEIVNSHQSWKKILSNRIGIITDRMEYIAVQSFERVREQEKAMEKEILNLLTNYPLWTEYLKGIPGVGPLMGAVILSEFNIYKADYVSSMWKYAGLDVVVDENNKGTGRGRRKDHQVPRPLWDSEGNPIIDKETGEQKVVDGLTFNPFLKTKLLGVLAPSFLKVNGISIKNGGPGSVYANIYYARKHQETSQRNLLIQRYEREGKTKDQIKKLIMSDGHIHNRAMRYAIKMFIRDLYPVWKEMEGLPVAMSYEEKKFGMKPHKHAGIQMPRAASM